MITVEFKNFDEMMQFARQLAGVETTQIKTVTECATSAASIQETPVMPSGQALVNAPDSAPQTADPTLASLATAASTRVSPSAATTSWNAFAGAPNGQPQVPVTAPGFVPASTPAPAPVPIPTPDDPVPMPYRPSAPVPASTSVPVSTPGYTLDDLARAGMTLMDAGKQGDLLGLLKEFGVEALPALPPAQYGAFATRLRTLGAQI